MVKYYKNLLIMTTNQYIPTTYCGSTPHIMVAVSGGVDSAVTAALLQKEGYKVTGVFMRNWEDDDGTEECTSMEDWLDAQKVCDSLNIELLQTNFSKEYKAQVFEPFIELLKKGHTPNPDVLCNAMIKFAALREFALNQGADFLATGHYSRLVQDGEHTLLFQAKDQEKCQSYFLYRVGSFAKCLMPLGNMQKDQVRTLAKQMGLHNHNRRDSTGICFIGKRNFSKFIDRYITEQPGNIVDESGKIVGQHKGLFHYTLGQRQGLGIGGIKGGIKSEANDTYSAPWFVIGKNMLENQLIVTQGEEASSLYSSELTADSLQWIGPKPELSLRPFACQAKVRYRSVTSSCTLQLTQGSAEDPEQVIVKFNEPQRALTLGQSVVFYLDDRCLGGGIICG